MRSALLVLVVVCFGINQTTCAQVGTISGKVVDAATNEPLPFTNVFINNSTQGTTTDLNGEFTLRNLNRPAVYELVVSFVGYKTLANKISLSGSEVRMGILRLATAGLELNAVEVSSKRDTRWERNLKRFKKIFLGDDEAAEKCMILNPWALEFQDLEGPLKFVATAAKPLEIENRFLGYRLIFYLTSFKASRVAYQIRGNVRFEAMASTDSTEARTWLINRNKNYLRGRQHLFKAMVDHRIYGEGFNLFTEVDQNETSLTRTQNFQPQLGGRLKWCDTLGLVSKTGDSGIYRIHLPHRLEVHYRKEKAVVRTYRDIFYPFSWMEANSKSILVNRLGVEVNAADIVVS